MRNIFQAFVLMGLMAGSMIPNMANAQTIYALKFDDDFLKFWEDDAEDVGHKIRINAVAPFTGVSVVADQDTTFRIQTMQFKEAVSGVDYVPFDKTVTLKNGASYVDVPISLIDDGNVEKYEHFRIRVSTDENSTAVIYTSDTTCTATDTCPTKMDAEVRIYSDEIMFLGLEQEHMYVQEGDTADLCLIFWIVDGPHADNEYHHAVRNPQYHNPDAVVDFPFQLSFSPLRGTATIDVDYYDFKPNREKTVAAGLKHGGRVCKPIEIRTDSKAEVTEQFKVVVERLPGINSYAEFEPTELDIFAGDGTYATTFKINILDKGHDTPANLAIRASGRAGYIDVVWDAVATATRYEVHHRQQPFDCEMGWKDRVDKYGEHSRTYDVIGDCPFTVLPLGADVTSAQFKAKAQANGVIHPVELQVVAYGPDPNDGGANPKIIPIASSPMTDMMLDDDDNTTETEPRLTGQVGCQYQRGICIRDLTMSLGRQEIHLGWPETPGAGHHDYSQGSRRSPYYRVEWKRADAGMEEDWSSAESATIRKQFGDRNHLYNGTGDRLGLPVNYTIRGLYSGKEYLVRVIALGEVNGPPSRVLRGKPKPGANEGRFRFISRTKGLRQDAPGNSCPTNNCVTEGLTFKVCTVLERSDGNDFTLTQAVPLSFEVVGETPAVEGRDYDWPTAEFPVGYTQATGERCETVTATNAGYEVEWDETVNFKVSHGFATVPSEFDKIDSSKPMHFRIVDNDVVEMKIAEVLYEHDEGDGTVPIVVKMESANAEVDCLIRFPVYFRMANTPHTTTLQEDPNNPLPDPWELDPPNPFNNVYSKNTDLPYDRVDGYYIDHRFSIPACEDRVTVYWNINDDPHVERQTEQTFFAIHPVRNDPDPTKNNPAGLRVNSRSSFEISDNDSVDLLFADLGEKVDPPDLPGRTKYRLAKYTVEEGAVVDVGWQAKNAEVEEANVAFPFRFAVREKSSTGLVEIFGDGRVDDTQEHNVNGGNYVNEGTFPVRVGHVDEDTKAYLNMDGSLLRFQDSIKTFTDQLVEINITDASPYRIDITKDSYSLGESDTLQLVCIRLVRTDDGTQNFQHPNSAVFTFTTSDGTAIAGADYFAQDDTITLVKNSDSGNGGSTECRAIFMFTDTVEEDLEEHFFVHTKLAPNGTHDFSNVTDLATFGTINGDKAQITILDDDGGNAPPEVLSTNALVGLQHIETRYYTAAPLVDGSVITTEADETHGIRALSKPNAPVGSVKFMLHHPDGTTTERIERVAPWSMWGDAPNGHGGYIFHGSTLAVGEYTLDVYSYGTTDASGLTTGTLSVSFSVEDASTPVVPAIRGFELVDASDQIAIAELTQGMEVDLSGHHGKDVAVQVLTEDSRDVESVVISLSGPKSVTRTESIAPWSLYGDDYEGDRVGNLFGEPLPAGEYTLEAVAYSEDFGAGTQLGVISVNFEVLEQPEVSVDDDTAEEGVDDLSFAVTLSRASLATVKVNYATQDGTATVANEDYTATSGTLTFNPGEQSATIRVQVLDDNIDEGTETMKLLLSSPTNIDIGDGEGIGTITNSDVLPKAWTARFGHLIAGQAAEAIWERLDRTLGTSINIAGQEINLDEEAAPIPDNDKGQVLDSQDLFLSGRMFQWGAAQDEVGSGIAAWGRISRDSLSTREGATNLNGTVGSLFLGVDAGDNDRLMGVMFGHSIGEGGYTFKGEEGEIQSNLTSIYPYWKRTFKHFDAWGSLGYGVGTLRVDSYEANLNMYTGIIGLRRSLHDDGRLSMNIRSDVFWNRIDSDRTNGMTSSVATSYRGRMMISGEYELTKDEFSLTPSVAAGLRYDGGDVTEGLGIELSPGLEYSWRNLSIEGKARKFITQGSENEWGISGSISISQQYTERGFYATLRQSYGSVGDGGQTLWDQGVSEETGISGGTELSLDLGYGLGPLGEMRSVTPYYTSRLNRNWSTGVLLGIFNAELDVSYEHSEEARISASLRVGF